MAIFILFVNSGDPDQTLSSAVSDLGLHCLPVILLGVSRRQWVNTLWANSADDKLVIFSSFFPFFMQINCLLRAQFV